ncbi:efflux RND transporter periplasmic adaptor subunit [Croceibacterium atlanticum]|nr:efflux RND transporter periplasmic adaptor subunit [Croceibacterium atlanticum]
MPALMLSACGSGADAPSGAGPAPLVKVAQPAPHVFVDVIEAVGTARANEQVTIASPVAERVEKLLFDDGDFVRSGQLIATLDQAQEQAALQSAMAQEELARTQLERIQSLFDRGFATQAQLDQQVAQAAQARANADDARARIADRTIRAPLTGAVSLRTISPGTIVSVGDAIATVSDLSRIKLDFSVPETALGSLRAGQPITVTSAAFPGETFTGTVSVIDPVIDPATRALLVRAILPNPGARLKPGMLLEVAVQSARRSALAVPELSIVGEGQDRFVYVVGADGKVKRTNVQTGMRDNGVIEIIGLAPTNRVVTEGVIKVADGIEVQIEGDSQGRAG